MTAGGYHLYNDPDRKLSPTVGQLRIFKAYMLGYSQKEAASICGLKLHTVKAQLCDLYYRLGVNSALEAAYKLGWLRIPPEDGSVLCGWIGMCSRPLGHDEDHGDMRKLREII